MPKKAGILLLTLGAVLILSALLLFRHNSLEDERAGLEAEAMLIDVRAAISERAEQAPAPTPTPPESAAGAPAETPVQELTVVEIDGQEYIGYLSIPALGIELPVMSGWDYDKLKLAPCRQFGSTRTDDLVIAAHNYKRHFGGLSSLSAGDTITFTDMDGEVSTYAVAKVETLDPKAVEAVQNSGYDLVLYTCTYGGASRVTAFCNRALAAVKPGSGVSAAE